MLMVSPSLKVAQSSICGHYADGLSITQGSTKQHLWTLAVGLSENFDGTTSCPRDKDPFNFDNVPDFVGDHFYCETGFATTTSV